MVYQYFLRLQERRRQRAGTLSGGAQAMLAFRRTPIGPPRLILLDGSSEGLQPNLVQHLGEVLMGINAELGATVLLAERSRYQGPGDSRALPRRLEKENASMREIRQQGTHHYVFSRYVEPIATVQPGETVAVYTDDAFESRITRPDDKPSEILGAYLNPQTGPIYIEGAEPGDTLAVKIEAIEPTRDWAVSVFVPFFGGLTSTRLTRTLQEPLPEKVWIYQLADGWLTHNERLRFPWRPFMGTIGTAPELEALSALTPFDHGGNMDVPDVKPGNTIYLPVRAPGALFFTGDCHAGQGQGELCGVALEITARVTLTFNLIKQQPIAWPRIESQDELMVVGSARPMEDAARIAYTELVEWLVELGWDRWEAYEALTQIGDLYVGNMVDTYYSLVAKIRKEYALFDR